MTDSSSYFVFPKKPDPGFSPSNPYSPLFWLRSLAMGSAWAIVGLIPAWLVLGILCAFFYMLGGVLWPAFVSFANTLFFTWKGACGIYIFVWIGAVITLYVQHSPATHKKMIQEISSENAKEAERVSLELRRVLVSVEDLKTELSRLLMHASQALELARNEFAERVPDPFWTAIENAAIALGSFRKTVDKLKPLNVKYVAMLENQVHTFPDFPATAELLPDPRPVLDDLRTVARMGMKDPDFAQIWEAHKTRHVLIEGFANLSDAVYNVGDRIVNELAKLNETVRQGNAKIIAALIASSAVQHVDAHKQQARLDDIFRQVKK